MVHLGKIEHPMLDQMDVYDEMRQELEDEYFGRWVVIDGGQLVGNYGTFDEARADAREKGLNPLNLPRHPSWGGAVAALADHTERVSELTETFEYSVPPAEILRRGPYILVEIGGGSASALLDTGASFSAIDIATGTRLAVAGKTKNPTMRWGLPEEANILDFK